MSEHKEFTLEVKRVAGRTCTIEGCDKKHVARGLCSKHYNRYNRHGSPSICLYDRDIGERLQERIMPIPESGCHVWMGAVNDFGYGSMSISGKSKTTHRISYELYHGEIPTGLCVLHKCDIPSCVNPHHLYVGTQADNTRDKIKRGRDNVPQGENHPDAKLTNKQAWYAYILGKSGMPATKIANAYRVHPEIIRGIIREERYVKSIRAQFG